jgi:hypothetical protein
VEPEEMAVSRQKLDKHCSRGKALLDTVFYAVRDVCNTEYVMKRKVGDATLQAGRKTVKHGHESRGTWNQI